MSDSSTPSPNAHLSRAQLAATQRPVPQPPATQPDETKPATFESSLWTVLASIPPGKVTTYGQLAKLCGYPNQARQVGRLLKNLPEDSQLPWHRVINSRGKISLDMNSESGQKQRQRLLDEGVEVSEAGAVSLRRFLF